MALLASLLAALIALAAPAWAAAADFVVNATGDDQTAPACAVGMGECTLRGAIEATDSATPGPNTITFSPTVFNGEAGDTIAPGATSLLPPVTTPTTIDGAGCNAGSAVPCLSGANATNSPLILLNANATKLENLSITIPSGLVGIRMTGAHSIEVLDNTIAMTGTVNPSTGIESSFGASGALIEGNTITSALGFNYSISLRGGSNRILGNELIGAGCCQAGVTIELGGAANQIGGDTEASENVFQGLGGGAITMNNSPTNSSHNEVRRNRGASALNFVNGAGVAAPTIAEPFLTSVAGTAEPGAKVRLFRKATESAGEIEGFLGEAVAAAGTGAWEVSFAKAPIGTFVAATQTLTGSTSSLGGTAALVESPTEKAEREAAEKAQQEKEAAEKAAKEKEAAEKAAREREAAERAARERQETEAREQREREAREKESAGGGSGGGASGGSSGSGSGSGSGSTNPTPAPVPPAPVAKVAPKVRITAGPRRTSTATTARFRFRATNVSGATFECRLDAAKWASCRAPKTYRGLRPGRHIFMVRAKANGLTGAAARYVFTTKA
jgi:hypothetical protein